MQAFTVITEAELRPGDVVIDAKRGEIFVTSVSGTTAKIAQGIDANGQPWRVLLLHPTNLLIRTRQLPLKELNQWTTNTR